MSMSNEVDVVRVVLLAAQLQPPRGKGQWFCNQFSNLNIFSDEEEQRDREREKGEKDCEKETIRTAGFQK